MLAAAACCVVVCVRDCGRVCRERAPLTTRRQLTAACLSLPPRSWTTNGEGGRRVWRVATPSSTNALQAHTLLATAVCVNSLARSPRSWQRLRGARPRRQTMRPGTVGCATSSCELNTRRRTRVPQKIPYRSKVIDQSAFRTCDRKFGTVAATCECRCGRPTGCRAPVTPPAPALKPDSWHTQPSFGATIMPLCFDCTPTTFRRGRSGMRTFPGRAGSVTAYCRSLGGLTLPAC